MTRVLYLFLNAVFNISRRLGISAGAWSETVSPLVSGSNPFVVRTSNSVLTAYITLMANERTKKPVPACANL